MNQLPQANKDIWKINIAIYNGHLVSAYTLESLNLIHVRFARYHRAGLNTPDNKKTIYWACFGSFIRTNFGFFSAIVQNSVGTGRREPWERGWGWPLKGGSRRSCVFRCHTAVYQGQGIVAGCWPSVSTLAMWSSALTTEESISCPRIMVGRQESISVEEKWAPQTAQVIATREL